LRPRLLAHQHKRPDRRRKRDHDGEKAGQKLSAQKVS
jgi:hypothetical protein